MLGGASCVTLGFAAGSLACAGDCTFDTSGCTHCGNGLIDASEQCDGAELGAASCVTLGYASGTLACTGACVLDASGCTAVCAGDAAPQITLAPTLSAGMSQSFVLSAAVVDEAPESSLVISWSSSAGAPLLTGTNTLAPSGVAGECGSATYTITVTDPCGHSATDSIDLVVEANGPDVSKDTCVASHQCGSAALPWCTIQGGVDHAAGGEVHVAASNTSYVESVFMHNGVDVLGGYETTFTAPRNADPSTNGTGITSAFSAVIWPSNVFAALDGFRIVPTMPTQSDVLRGVLSVSGTASATIANVLVAPSVGTAKFATDVGVRVGPGTGGSTWIANSTINGPKGTGTSLAVATDAQAESALTITTSALLAVAPTSTTGASTGLELRGTGATTVNQSTIKSGLVATTYGVRAYPTAAPASRTIVLNDTAIEANRGKEACGVRVDGGAAFEIHGGSVMGKGTTDQGSSVNLSNARGIKLDSVGTSIIDDVTVLASDSVGTYSNQSGSAYAVEVSDLNATGATCTVTNATLTGGTIGEARRGIVSTGVPLDISQSDIAASRTNITSGNGGPTDVAGVEVEGTFPAGVQLRVHDNFSIVGGDVSDPCNDTECGSAAILVDATTDSIIEGNQTIRGAFVHSGFEADGIRINEGGSHVIQNNASISAGGQLGGDVREFAGVKVWGIGTLVANVTMTGNMLIAGTAGATEYARQPTGFYGAGVNAVISNNARILGGHGETPRGVTITRARASSSGGATTGTPNTVSITDNVIDGGERGARGLVLSWQTNSTVTGNVISACGMRDGAGLPLPGCLTTASSFGIAVEGDDGSLIANNYVFGGYTSSTTACRIGCFGTTNCWHQLATSFVDNLCLAKSTFYSSVTLNATALDLGAPAPTDCPLIAGNVLDASGTVGTVRALSHAQSGGTYVPTECFQLLNNDIVPRGLACQAYVLLPPDICFASAAALDARANAFQQMSGNVDIAPLYASEDPQSPDAADYHLDSTCALGGLGVDVNGVAVDFDGEPRAAGPTIGPDECQ